MSATSSACTIAARQQRSNTSNDECHLTASPTKPRQRSSRKRPVRVSAQGLGIWTKINIPTSQFSICMSVHKFRNIGCPTLDSFLDSDSGTKVSYRQQRRIWAVKPLPHLGKAGADCAQTTLWYQAIMPCGSVSAAKQETKDCLLI